MDYEKKYKEALERARQFSEKPYLEDSKGIVDYIFPELIESEDEKIRKDLINYFNGAALEHREEEVLAWLEKQGKNNMGISEATKKKLEDNLNKALEKETPESFNEFLDEQKPVDSTFEIKPKFKVGDTIRELETGNLFYVNSVEDFGYTLHYKNCNANGCTMSFKYEDNYELVEPKPAWSKEDEDILNTIINHFKIDIECTDEDDVIRWLKSLRPQSTWKPTEQQMKVLNEVINFTADHGTMRWNDYIYNVLKGLREQLKKLTE